jgi:hypothetical protein
MKFMKIRFQLLKRVAKLVLPVIFLFGLYQQVSAQEPPPRPLQVTIDQSLGFGAFAQGPAGGTITVNTAGIRSFTGDIIMLNLGYSFSAATYRITGNAGTVVSILNGTDVSLPGSNGGSMILHIGASDPASPFVLLTSPPAFTLMNVGATLSVGNPASNPPGNYSGTFDITFIQE